MVSICQPIFTRIVVTLVTGGHAGYRGLNVSGEPDLLSVIITANSICPTVSKNAIDFLANPGYNILVVQ